MNYERLASELVRALRGRRSQAALSRRLGYSSNVVFSWEAGEGFPTAAKFFRLATALGHAPLDAVRRFARRPDDWLAGADLTEKGGVRELLVALAGNRALGALSQAVGRDRFAVSRWLSGKTEPRLPDFLRFVEAATLGLLDFLAVWVEPSMLGEVAHAWRSLKAARSSAYELPWSHAVLRMTELAQYRALERHEPGFFASRLGISTHDEQRCLDLLVESGNLRRVGERYEPTEQMTVDTRADPKATRHLAGFWMQLGAERVRAHAPGNFAFNVFGVSRADLERLRQLQRDYFAEMRAIIARSEPTEHVAVATFQLYSLG